MLSGVCAGHQQGPEQLVKSRALGTQLPTGVVGRGLVSQPVSNMVVQPMGMPTITSSDTDMPKTSFSDNFLAFLFIGFKPFLVIAVSLHKTWTNHAHCKSK